VCLELLYFNVQRAILDLTINTLRPWFDARNKTIIKDKGSRMGSTIKPLRVCVFNPNAVFERHY